MLDFAIPPDRIARFPSPERTDAKMLVVFRDTARPLIHSRVHTLGEYLREGDLLVLNDSKVIPARLFGRTQYGGKVELLLVRPVSESRSQTRWQCLARPRKPGRLHFAEGVEAELTPSEGPLGEVSFFSVPGDFLSWLDRHGEVPLPPYLKRAATEEDRERYQTVYAQEAGSVAAPTAGLHFSERLLERLQAQGIEVGRVTLHVGYGTFAPVRPEQLAKGELHPEFFRVTEHTRAQISRCRARGGRVFAVGTTTVRALESSCRMGEEGESRLFIRPGHDFRLVDGLMTNFHLEGSSLLELVGAFLGVDHLRKAYATALCHGYRFYSYGDAMLIIP